MEAVGKRMGGLLSVGARVELDSFVYATGQHQVCINHAPFHDVMMTCSVLFLSILSGVSECNLLHQLAEECIYLSLTL